MLQAPHSNRGRSGLAESHRWNLWDLSVAARELQRCMGARAAVLGSSRFPKESQPCTLWVYLSVDMTVEVGVRPCPRHIPDVCGGSYAQVRVGVDGHISRAIRRLRSTTFLWSLFSEDAVAD